MPNDRDFNPLSRNDEMTLLQSDDRDFSSTQLYLMPLIIQALHRMALPVEEYEKTRNALLADVQVAAKRFLAGASPLNKYKFSAYFTWYIHERFK